jgi:hypothetical protein
VVPLLFFCISFEEEEEEEEEKEDGKPNAPHGDKRATR